MNYFIGILFFILLAYLIYHYAIKPDVTRAAKVVKNKSIITGVPATNFDPNKLNVVTY